MRVRPAGGPRPSHELSERQASVLRAVVAGYVGEAAPIGSKTLARMLPISLSSASVRSVLGELAEGGTSFAWENEPRALGAYAYFRPGQMSALVPHLATPEGRVHFAGCHTSAWTGWMEGAVQSGKRAAAELLARLPV